MPTLIHIHFNLLVLQKADICPFVLILSLVLLQVIPRIVACFEIPMRRTLEARNARDDITLMIIPMIIKFMD